MSFKEQATADLATFLNVDEFANTVVIDGESVACSVEGNGDTVGNDDGVINVDTVVYARASDFYKRPVIDQRLTVDGKGANVVGVSEDQGILTLRLKWLDS